MGHCGCTLQRKTVYDYFQHACCRVTAARAGLAGALVYGEDGAFAQFFLQIVAGKLAGVSYKCTSCVTLIALCEHLAELAADSAEQLTPARLLELHPEIPLSKQDRAALAVAAFQAAMKELKT